jgi:hypothetical protein
MDRRLNVTLALIAGLVGGLASRYLTPIPVFAQAETPIPKELKARQFVIVNQEGKALGVFGLDPDGTPMIKLIDERGRTLWSTQPSILLQSRR